MKTQRCANSWRHWGRYWSRHRVSQKAQQFLVEALQNNTVCQRKKVTEENKTAELPGSALPTHTLTYKCRYATYSRRFTESNPPHTHANTQRHTHTSSFVSLVFSLSYKQIFSQVIQIRVLNVSHLTFASGQHRGQKVFWHHLPDRKHLLQRQNHNPNEQHCMLLINWDISTIVIENLSDSIWYKRWKQYLFMYLFAFFGGCFCCRCKQKDWVHFCTFGKQI